MPKNTEVKQTTALTSKETREVMQKDEHSRKARNQGTTENSHSGSCTNSLGSIHVKSTKYST
jgi:hypothetical protein